jgi:hypothetical protein
LFQKFHNFTKLFHFPKSQARFGQGNLGGFLLFKAQRTAYQEPVAVLHLQLFSALWLESLQPPHGAPCSAVHWPTRQKARQAKRAQELQTISHPSKKG